MAVSMTPFIKGVLIGIGASALGFCLYKSNEEKVDDFMRHHGINVKSSSTGLESMGVEDLMRTKEHIEDLIAEKEMEEQSVTVEADAPAKA